MSVEGKRGIGEWTFSFSLMFLPLNFTYLAADLHQFRKFHLFIFEGFTFLKEGRDSGQRNGVSFPLILSHDGNIRLAELRPLVLFQAAQDDRGSRIYLL